MASGGNEYPSTLLFVQLGWLRTGRPKPQLSMLSLISCSIWYLPTVEVPQILGNLRLEKTEQAFFAVATSAVWVPSEVEAVMVKSVVRAGEEETQQDFAVEASAGLAPTLAVVQASKFPLPSSEPGDVPLYRRSVSGLRRC